jgi:hypothetical protein
MQNIVSSFNLGRPQPKTQYLFVSFTLYSSLLLRSDLSWALTHAEKLVFSFAYSHVTLSNVTFIGLILLASIELLMNLCARIAKKDYPPKGSLLF